LEAACYGVPILFGNRNFEKFQEARDLINRGGAFEIADYTDLKAKFEMLNLPENFLLACDVTRLYVEENLGATEKIMQYCRVIVSR
jgi:3-deoxy-D-manno-octulosonic-acid transferase